MGLASHPLRVGDAHRELDFSIYHIQARESYPCRRCQQNRRKWCMCCNVSKAWKRIKMFKEELSLRKKFRIVPPFAPPLNSYYLCEMRQMAQPLQAVGSSAGRIDGCSDPCSVRAPALTFSGCVHLGLRCLPVPVRWEGPHSCLIHACETPLPLSTHLCL